MNGLNLFLDEANHKDEKDKTVMCVCHHPIDNGQLATGTPA